MEQTVLDKMCRNILKFVLNAQENQKAGIDVNFKAHHDLAEKAAAESAVLLKNDNNALPINSV